jgi:hypothetical protein
LRKLRLSLIDDGNACVGVEATERLRENAISLRVEEEFVDGDFV